MDRTSNAGSVQSYVDELTKDLAVELEPFGVTVENQAPFYVATKMSKIRRPRLDAPTPKAWVASGIRQIGCATPAPVSLQHPALVLLLAAPSVHAVAKAADSSVAGHLQTFVTGASVLTSYPSRVVAVGEHLLASSRQGLRVDVIDACRCRHNSRKTPYWFHAVMVGVINAAPVSVVNAYLVREHQKFRSLWYKKQERTQKKAI